MKSKNKKSFPGSLAAILLATAIVFGGIASMLAVQKLLPDYKNSTVKMDLPEGSGLYYAQQNTDISLLYPWVTLTGEEAYISSDIPQWLIDSKKTFEECYPQKSEIDATQSLSYTYRDGIYYLKSESVNDELYYSYSVNAAFEKGGRLISFETDIGYTGVGVSSEEINTVYEVIGESAFSNQNKTDGLARYLDDLTNGVYVYSEDYIFDEETGEYVADDTSSLSFEDSDPVCDFYRRYCAYCSQNGVVNTDALYIYTLLRYGTYACIYSEEQIFLVYNIADFGRLTLSWSVADGELCAMTIDAREANPAKIPTE